MRSIFLSVYFSTLSISMIGGLSVVLFGAESLDFTVNGGSADLQERLEAASQLVQTRQEGDDDPQALFAAGQTDYRNILAVLYDEGFYGARISIRFDGREVSEISPLAPPVSVSEVRVSIDAGEAFVFGRAIIRPYLASTPLPGGFKAGAPARSDLIGEAARAAARGFRDQGYAMVEIAEESVVADHINRRLDTEIALDPGPRVSFGQLTLEGDSRVSEARLHQIAGFPSGEIYSPAKVKLVSERLRRTGTFRSVQLSEASTLNAGNTLDVTAALIADKPRRIGAGVEFSSLNGLTLSGYWLHRNFFGGAENFRVDAEVAQIGADSGRYDPDIKLSGRMARPAFIHPDNTLVAAFTLEERDEPGYHSRNVAGQVGVEWRYVEHLSFGGALGFLYSEVVEKDQAEVRDFEFLTLPLFANLDHRDTPLDARSGYFLAATLMPFFSPDGTSGIRLTGDLRGYYGVDVADQKNRLVLAARVQVGSILSADLVEVPPDYRFFSGGGGTVRGQKYKSLGVEFADGTQSGGNSFIGLSAEARFKASEKIGLVGFVDFGQVGSGSLFGKDSTSHGGAGLGLRYDTVIGPLRVDIAVPIEESIEGVEVYIGIGQAF